MPQLQPGATYDPLPDTDAFRKLVISGLDPMGTGVMDPRGWTEPSHIAQVLGNTALSAAGPKGAGLSEAALHLIPILKSRFAPMYSHGILSDVGKDVGHVRISHSPLNPTALKLESIASSGEMGGRNAMGGMLNAFGPRDMLSLMRDLKANYPEALSVTGVARVPGLGPGKVRDPRVGGYGYKPTNVANVKPLTEEDIANKKVAFEQFIKDVYTGLTHPPHNIDYERMVGMIKGRDMPPPYHPTSSGPSLVEQRTQEALNPIPGRSPFGRTLEEEARAESAHGLIGRLMRGEPLQSTGLMQAAEELGLPSQMSPMEARIQRALMGGQPTEQQVYEQLAPRPDRMTIRDMQAQGMTVREMRQQRAFEEAGYTPEEAFQIIRGDHPPQPQSIGEAFSGSINEALGRMSPLEQELERQRANVAQPAPPMTESARRRREIQPDQEQEYLRRMRAAAGIPEPGE